jgi:protein-L-isoaspartate(D-aspartate) O-methyltransferase
MTSQRTRDRMIANLRESGIRNERVLEILSTLPRHLFVDEALASRAYENTALPIGHGQTISQPYIVARMTEALLAFGPLGKVLEIGTGCGYQTAVLAHLAERVYSVERLEPLLERARTVVRGLGLSNVVFSHSDGTMGWAGEAPFDAIMVAAAPDEVPQALCDQLADGGTMVIPVGSRRAQQLLRLRRTSNGIETQTLEPVRFVPLIGQ